MRSDQLIFAYALTRIAAKDDTAFVGVAGVRTVAHAFTRGSETWARERKLSFARSSGLTNLGTLEFPRLKAWATVLTPASPTFAVTKQKFGVLLGRRRGRARSSRFALYSRGATQQRYPFGASGFATLAVVINDSSVSMSSFCEPRTIVTCFGGYDGGSYVTITSPTFACDKPALA